MSYVVVALPPTTEKLVGVPTIVLVELGDKVKVAAA
jgi:hypothetical protein